MFKTTVSIGLLVLAAGCAGRTEPDHAQFQYRLERAGGWSDIQWTKTEHSYSVEARHTIAGENCLFRLSVSNGSAWEGIFVDSQSYCVYERSEASNTRGLSSKATPLIKANSAEVHRLADEFWDTFFGVQ